MTVSFRLETDADEPFLRRLITSTIVEGWAWQRGPSRCARILPTCSIRSAGMPSAFTFRRAKAES